MADLLERDHDLSLLRELVAAAAQRHGSLVMITGEAGIGKSSLVQAWLDDPGSDARTMIGWCDDFLTQQTLAPLHDIARTIGGALGDAVAQADTRAVLDALLEELGHPLRPTVLVLEDVHWADEATLDVVRYLGRRIQRLPAVLAVTFRDDEVDRDHPLRGVLGALPAGYAHRIRPHPLSTSAVAELTSGSGLDPAELVRITGGNPFFVTEVAQGNGAVPVTVADSVLGRLRPLPVATRRAVELLAVLPSSASWELVTDLGLSTGDLAVAEQHGLLIADVERIRFRHELARRAVEGSLTTVSRAEHHEQVLEALLRRGSQPAAILHHAVEARRGDIVARDGPAAAHDAFVAGAYREALAHQDHVLAYIEALEPAVLAWLLLERSWTLYNLHRFQQATEAAERSAAIYKQLEDHQSHCRGLITYSRMLYMTNRTPDAFTVLDEAAQLLPSCESYVEVEFNVHRLSLLHLSDRYTEVLAEADAAIAQAAAIERFDLVAHGENYAGCSTAVLGDFDAGLVRLRRAVEGALTSRSLEAAARAYTNLVEILVSARRWDEAASVIEQALTFYDDHDFRAHRYNTAAQLARKSILQGDWTDADRLLREVEESVRGAGVLEAIPLDGRALLAVRSGADDAPSRLDEAWDVARRTGSAQYVVAVACTGIEWAWSTGRPEAAAKFVAAATEAGAGTVWLDGLMWRLPLIGGRAESKSGPSVSVAATARPEATSLSGDWRTAAEAWARLGMPYEQALDLLRSGDVQATTEALRILDQLGAAPAARIARRQLRELGITAVPRGPVSATREHPLGLTGRQAEVLELLAQGLTNAQIAEELVVSVRTVDHHVTAILRKLGVATRQEAAARAASLAMLPGPKTPNRHS